MKRTDSYERMKTIYLMDLHIMAFVHAGTTENGKTKPLMPST